MGFVANGNTTPSQIIIKSDPFYPSVDLDHIREIVRIDGAITNQRLQQTIIEEVIDLNRLLKSLKEKAIVLRAEEGVPIEKAVGVLDIANKNQIKVVLAVRPK